VETLAGLGTQMRHVLELLDGDVARVYADLGLADYRPRFSPVIRALVALGPLSIRDLASAIGVTHSGASQTAAQMARDGLLTLEPGADARQRIARLTDRARDLLPLIEAEWAATDAAAAELEAELPAALGENLRVAERAVVSRPMRTRIADAARMLQAALPAGDDSAPVAARRAALRAIAGDDPGAPDSGSPRLPSGDAG
jgi:DNA-binding MarR family transcriptional regulator